MPTRSPRSYSDHSPGRLTDRVGRRPLLIGGALLAAACLALTAVATDLVTIIVLRLVAGVAEAAFFVAGFAALADIAPAERIGEALSYNSLGLYLGIALGPLLGELLLENLGYPAALVRRRRARGHLGRARARHRRDEHDADRAGRTVPHRPPAIDPGVDRLPSPPSPPSAGSSPSPRCTRLGSDRRPEPRAVHLRSHRRHLPDRVRPCSRPPAVAAARCCGPRDDRHRPRADGALAGAVGRRRGHRGHRRRRQLQHARVLLGDLRHGAPEGRGIASGTATAAIDLGLGIGPILLGFVAAPYGIPWAFAVAATVAFAGAAWTLRLSRQTPASTDGRVAPQARESDPPPCRPVPGLPLRYPHPVPPATDDRFGSDRYGEDVLAGDWRAAGRRSIPEVPATRELVVELAADGYCGAVVSVEKQTVTLEDRHGRTRMFPLGLGFLVDGEPVRLVAPKAAVPQGRLRTASGSFATESAPAKVALPSRIFVEGRHDAELVEKIWGADLRVEGVVVEYLEGVDVLGDVLDGFRPARGDGSACSSTTSCRARRSSASPTRSCADGTAATCSSSDTRTSTSGRR